jgi:hypothetical protein
MYNFLTLFKCILNRVELSALDMQEQQALDLSACRRSKQAIIKGGPQTFSSKIEGGLHSCVPTLTKYKKWTNNAENGLKIAQIGLKKSKAKDALKCLKWDLLSCFRRF